MSYVLCGQSRTPLYIPAVFHICTEKHMNDGGIYMSSQGNILKQ